MPKNNLTRVSNPSVVTSTIFLLTFSHFCYSEQTITPIEMQSILINPGMGIETFQGFTQKSDRLQEDVTPVKNPEVAPPKDLSTPENQQRDRRGFRRFGGRSMHRNNYPPSTIAYFRFTWRELEPNEEVYDFSRIKSSLKQARENGQDIAFGLTPYSSVGAELNRDKNGQITGRSKSGRSTPKWYIDQGRGMWIPAKNARGRWTGSLQPDDETWCINFNEDFFIERQKQLVAAIAEAFDGNPDLLYVDLRSVGFWGEWHSNGMKNILPSIDKCKEIINCYFDNFKTTPLLVPLQISDIDESLIHYAIDKGAGWRFDGIDVLKPQRIVRVGIQDVWKTARISGESVSNTFLNGSAQEVLSKYTNLHLASYNGKSRGIESKDVPYLNSFLLNSGYRLVLKRLKAPTELSKDQQQMNLELEWTNKGNTPPYKAFILAVKLSNSSYSNEFYLNSDLTTWLPNQKIYVNASIDLPDDLPTGKYHLSIGVLDPFYKTPEVKLAIEGRKDDGWYNMCSIIKH